MHEVLCRMAVMERHRRNFPTSLFIKKCSMGISIFWHLILKKCSFSTTNVATSRMIYLDVELDFFPSLGKVVRRKILFASIFQGETVNNCYPFNLQRFTKPHGLCVWFPHWIHNILVFFSGWVIWGEGLVWVFFKGMYVCTFFQVLALFPKWHCHTKSLQQMPVIWFSNVCALFFLFSLSRCDSLFQF